MTECNHNGEEIDFKLKAKPCTKCGKLLDLHEWTATIRRGATLAENKRVLDKLRKHPMRNGIAKVNEGEFEIIGLSPEEWERVIAALRLKDDGK